MTTTQVTVEFRIAHNVSSSKGWGRYRASAKGRPLVESSTGNEWVSAPHSGVVDAGTPIRVILQTMQRIGKTRRERIDGEEYRLIAQAEAVCVVGHYNGLEVAVAGARLADVLADEADR